MSNKSLITGSFTGIGIVGLLLICLFIYISTIKSQDIEEIAEITEITKIIQPTENTTSEQTTEEKDGTPGIHPAFIVLLIVLFMGCILACIEYSIHSMELSLLREENNILVNKDKEEERKDKEWGEVLDRFEELKERDGLLRSIDRRVREQRRLKRLIDANRKQELLNSER